MDSVQELLSFALEAFKSGNWNLIVSAVIMVLVWVVGKTPLVGALVKNAEHRIWVASFAGVLSAVVMNYMAGGGWLAAIAQGLTVGAAAGGLWSLVGKKLLGKPAE